MALIQLDDFCVRLRDGLPLAVRTGPTEHLHLSSRYAPDALISLVAPLLCTMCQYCMYNAEGWTKLLQYDDVYQAAIADLAESESTYGFHESWDELKADLMS